MFFNCIDTVETSYITLLLTLANNIVKLGTTSSNNNHTGLIIIRSMYVVTTISRDYVNTSKF